MNINIGNYKNQILNTAVILAALLVAAQIRGIQTKNIKSILGQKEERIKRNEILAEINKSAKLIDSQRKFFNREAVPTVIKTINTMTKDSGVKVISIKPVPEQDYSEYIVKHRVELDINADSYHTLGKFIGKLENYTDIFIMVESLKINLSSVYKESPKSYNLEADLRLNCFSLKD